MGLLLDFCNRGATEWSSRNWYLVKLDGNVDVFEKLDCNLNMDSEIKCWRVRNEV